MRLEDYSLDDLHIIATGEFDSDEAATQLLNAIYGSFVRVYADTLRELRQERVQ